MIRVVLGVGGGIAAYKAAELARALMEGGATVQVVMTAAAQEFVRPLTFAALTSRKVITGLFAERGGDEILSSAVEHIQVALNNDALVVAPATADLIARFAHGLADDFLTTMYLAFRGNVVLAPAMNTNMWSHPATQANLKLLRERGHRVVEPDEGPLACGIVGPGRLADPHRIAETVLAVSRRDWEGESVLITAGPTQEAIDPVRYVTNRSSGRMGYALAEAAALRGAGVVLVSGPVSLPSPAGVEVLRVRSAREMHGAVMDRLAAATVVIKAAAVADYRPARVADQKLKKTPERISLEMEPTPDILAEVGRCKTNQLLIGFAAETGDLEAEARRKLISKNCDMIVGNLVGGETGFESEENEVVLVLRSGGVLYLERASKREIADRILDQALELKRSR